jgi:DNA-binding CsgD family transcriptional regulator
MKFKNLNILLTFLMMIFFVVDVVTDILENSTKGFHFFSEVFFVTFLLYVLTYQLKEIKLIKEEVVTTRNQLSEIKDGLAKIINKQLEEWSFTPSEKEVSWLIIKGISYAKIADLKSISKRTVEQHASNIYKKSKVQNRHEFVTGFLEDIL